MSTIQLYRRALARSAASLLLTIANVVVAPTALYYSFGNWYAMAMVLPLLVILARTLASVWRHSLADWGEVQARAANLEPEQIAPSV
jgi:Zn-dependent protease with chaperone function